MKCRPPVMIIEDETDLRESFRDLLELEGFAVCTAANGAEGLRLLDEVGQPCLILLDLMMPVMNGWEFLEALQTRAKAGLSPDAVTVVSAAADVGDIQSQYGCNVLKKPVDFDRLIDLVKQHCR